MEIATRENDARERLQAHVRERGTSLAALSRLVGRNAAYLQQYVSRGSPRHLDEPDLQRIAQFLGVAVAEIATREVGGGRGDGAGLAAGEWVAIPRLDLDASAGPGRLGMREFPFDAYRFSHRWLRENGLEGADLSAIRVEGDSMEPLLRSGDEIFVDRRQRSGEGVFVVRTGEVLQVKQLENAGQGRIRLVSANPAYPPIDLRCREVEIIGRVVWKGGRL